MSSELQSSGAPDDNENIPDIHYRVDFWDPPSEQSEVSQWRSMGEHSNPELIGRFVRPDQIGYSHYELRPAGSLLQAMNYYTAPLPVEAENTEAFGSPDELQTINDARTVVDYWNYWRKAKRRVDSKDADRQPPHLSPIASRSFSEHASLIQEGIDHCAEGRKHNRDTTELEHTIIQYIKTAIDWYPAVYEQPYHVEIFDNLRDALENERPLRPHNPKDDKAPFDPASFYFSYNPTDTDDPSDPRTIPGK